MNHINHFVGGYILLALVFKKLMIRRPQVAQAMFCVYFKDAKYLKLQQAPRNYKYCAMNFNELKEQYAMFLSPLLYQGRKRCVTSSLNSYLPFPFIPSPPPTACRQTVNQEKCILYPRGGKCFISEDF